MAMIDPRRTARTGSRVTSPSIDTLPVSMSRRTPFQLAPGCSARSTRSSGPSLGAASLRSTNFCWGSALFGTRSAPSRRDVNLQDVAVEAEVRAVVELGAAGVAAHVKAALVEAVEEIETHRVARARFRGSRSAPELVDEKVRGFRRGRVARRDDRRMTHDHERLAHGCLLGETYEGLELRFVQAVAEVAGMHAVEQDHRVHALAPVRLAQDFLHRAVTRAPGAEPDAPHPRAANLGRHGLFDALHEPFEGTGLAKGRLVRTGADTERRGDEHGTVHRLHPFFASRFVAVKMEHHVELAARRERARARHDHLAHAGRAAPRFVATESRI